MRFRSKWHVLAVVELGVLLCSIDASIVLLALPTLSKALGCSIAEIQWVSVAYNLTCAATLALAGKSAEFLGRKTACLLGFGIFTIASVLSGLASTLPLLVAMRAFTALGAAFLLASGNAILTSVFPREQHGLALGLGATVFSIGVAAGFSLGALILQFASWRWIFLLNFPVGLLALAAGSAVLAPRVVGWGKPRTQPLDWPGGMLLLSSMLCLLLSLQKLAEGETRGALLLAAPAFLLGGLLIAVERRAADPVLPLWLFRIPEIATGSITRIIVRAGGAGAGFTLPFYLQYNLDLSPAATGMLLMTNVAMIAVAGPVSGHLSDRWGSGRVILAGLACFLGGLILHMALPDGARPSTLGIILLVILAQAVLGLGSAMFGSPNAKAAMHAAGQEHHAVISGILWTTTFLGQSAGTAAAAVILTASGPAATGPVQHQRLVFAVLAAAAALAFFLAWRHNRRKRNIAQP